MLKKDFQCGVDFVKKKFRCFNFNFVTSDYLNNLKRYNNISFQSAVKCDLKLVLV